MGRKLQTHPPKGFWAEFKLERKLNFKPKIPEDYLRRELVITTEPIDEAALVSGRSVRKDMGAAICFSGIVRETEAGGRIKGLEYECFGKMAEHQFHKLFDVVEERWPVESVRLVHRIGRVAAGECSLWVEVLAPHRGEAFAACQWLIDEMKKLVPIWKKQF